MKSRVEHRLHVRAIGLGSDVTAQQIPAVRIGDGERIAAGAVAGPKPAFEVRAPGLIGLLHFGEGLRIRRGAHALLAPMGEPGSLQHLAHGAFRGPLHLGLRRSKSFTRNFLGRHFQRWRAAMICAVISSLTLFGNATACGCGRPGSATPSAS